MILIFPKSSWIKSCDMLLKATSCMEAYFSHFTVMSFRKKYILRKSLLDKILHLIQKIGYSMKHLATDDRFRQGRDFCLSISFSFLDITKNNNHLISYNPSLFFFFIFKLFQIIFTIHTTIKESSHGLKSGYVIIFLLSFLQTIPL